MTSRFQIGVLAVVVLVLLRIGIGWHFLHEGVWKSRHPEFSAEPYLKQSRGAFAERYRTMIPDFYGFERLNPDHMAERWAAERDRIAEHFNYTAEQRKTADGYHARYVRELQDYLTPLIDPKQPERGRELERDIQRYLDEIQAWRVADHAPSTNQIPFEKERHWKKLQKLQADIAPWLQEVDALEKGLVAAVQALATPQQVQQARRYEPPPTQLKRLEKLTTYTLLIVGFCLMAGLFTRPAALAGAFFMITAVVMPQLSWPDTYPLPPPSAGHNLWITKEVIETLGLFLLAATPVGRWGGLDFFLHRLWTKVTGSRKQDESHA